MPGCSSRCRRGPMSLPLRWTISERPRIAWCKPRSSPRSANSAGIAHEIKNPLNFVNNFSALSAELTDELNDVLKPAPLNEKMREEVDELTGLLKDNLEKVVQHGKRADSIVKNMLLHPRVNSAWGAPSVHISNDGCNIVAAAP